LFSFLFMASELLCFRVIRLFCIVVDARAVSGWPSQSIPVYPGFPPLLPLFSPAFPRSCCLCFGPAMAAPSGFPPSPFADNVGPAFFSLTRALQLYGYQLRCLSLLYPPGPCPRQTGVRRNKVPPVLVVPLARSRSAGELRNLLPTFGSCLGFSYHFLFFFLLTSRENPCHRLVVFFTSPYLHLFFTGISVRQGLDIAFSDVLLPPVGPLMVDPSCRRYSPIPCPCPVFLMLPGKAYLPSFSFFGPL